MNITLRTLVCMIPIVVATSLQARASTSDPLPLRIADLMTEERAINTNDELHPAVPIDLAKTLGVPRSKLVPYLAPYLHDSSFLVRASLGEALVDPVNTEAKRMLFILALDPVGSVASVPYGWAYHSASCSDIVHYGGPSFRKSLLQQLADGSFGEDTFMMLSCYKGDKGVIHALRAERKAFGDREIGTEHFLPVKESLMIDVALGRLGDRAAWVRVDKAFSTHQLTVVRFLLDELRFIDDPILLDHLADTMLDSRSADPSADNLIDVGHERVYDMAIDAFKRKTGSDLGLKLTLEWTDARRLDAYHRLKKLYQTQVEQQKLHALKG